MQHLPGPEYLRHKIPKLPYLGIAPNYDRLGFDGFLDRIGVNQDELIRHLEEYQVHGGSIENDGWDLRFSPAWVSSLIQEWCWFGLMYEFEIACGITIEDELVRPDETDAGVTCVLDTSFLPAYCRGAVTARLYRHNISMKCRPGDLVRFRIIVTIW
jgi:hypothetical protein